MVPDWRSIPGLLALAERAAHNGLVFSQAKFERLWQIAEGVNVPPLFMLAILPQEGTGSFNTSAENRAADGGHGIEVDWERDVTAAVNLVAGKLALWPQAVAQGWSDLARRVTSPGWGTNADRSDGGPIEYVNWRTAILRPAGRVDVGPYAQHASWWLGVRTNFLSYGGTIAQLEEAARALDKRAPRVAMEFRLARNTGEASNWNATAPEPAVICTAAKITAPPEPVVVDKPSSRLVPVHINGGAKSIGGRTIAGEWRADQRVWITIDGIAVPVRAAAELFGGEVDWVDPDKPGGPAVRVRIGGLVP